MTKSGAARGAGGFVNPEHWSYSLRMVPCEEVRRQYLAAMGIQLWERRVPPGIAAAATERNRAQSTPDADAASAGPGPAADPVTVGEMDWQRLAAAVGACTRCGLHLGRNRTVFGTGDIHARWMFVGEAPGAEEDRQGEPFVGRAGQLLNGMLFALGLSREDVYIANVLKCRPPDNRDPQPDEVEQCEPYLLRQVDLIRPKLIVALGRHAAHSLLRTDLALGKLRGQQLEYHGIPLIVTYHPAYLLRNPADKRKAWEDLRLASRLMGAVP